VAKKIRIGRGRAMIDMDDTLHAMVERAVRRSNPRLIDRLEGEAADLHEDAVADWPVKTGRSRAALDHGLRLPSPDKIEAFVGVDTSKADYVYYIREDGKSTWHERVRKPGRERARKLAEALGRDMLVAIKGG
jgi:hypothetical protein